MDPDGEEYVAESCVDVNCKNKHLHHEFIPIKDFNKSHITGLKDEDADEFVSNVKYWGDRTVKVKVKGVSKRRPSFYKDTKDEFPYCKYRGDSRVVTYGSGFIVSLLYTKPYVIRCDCMICDATEKQPQSHREYFFIATSNHVIYDDSEAKKATFRCFYNDPEDNNERLLYGVRCFPYKDPEMNNREVTCLVLCVSHDEELSKDIKKIQLDYFTTFFESLAPPTVLVSHPHGWSKMVTIVKLVDITIPVEKSDHCTEKWKLNEYFDSNHLGEEDYPSVYCCLPYKLLPRISEQIEILFPYVFSIPDYFFALLAHFSESKLEGHDNDDNDKDDDENIINDNEECNNADDDINDEDQDNDNVAENDKDDDEIHIHDNDELNNDDGDINDEDQDNDNVAENDKVDDKNYIHDNDELNNDDSDNNDKDQDNDNVGDDKDDDNSSNDENQPSITHICPYITDYNTRSTEIKVYVEMVDGCREYQLQFFKKGTDSEYIPDPEEKILIKLPDQMTFALPSNAEFVARNTGCGFCFPGGTKFYSEEDDVIDLPSETAFLEMEQANINLANDVLVQYTSSLHPGSCGGPVVIGSLSVAMHMNVGITNGDTDMTKYSSRTVSDWIVEMAIRRYTKNVDWLLGDDWVRKMRTFIDFYVFDTRRVMLRAAIRSNTQTDFKIKHVLIEDSMTDIDENSGNGSNSQSGNGSMKAQGSVDDIDPDGEECFAEAQGDNCRDKHLHDQFIGINDLNQSHLPQGYQTEEFLKEVKTMADLTVRVMLVGVSKQRPDSHGPPFKGPFLFKKLRGSKTYNSLGSGFIIQQYKPGEFGEILCKCKLCGEGGKKQSQNWYFVVVTTSHVVYNVEEAKCAKFQCFFDEGDSKDRNTDVLYGLDYLPERVPGYANEEMSFVLGVTHDEKLGEKLKEILKNRTIEPTVEYEDCDDEDRPVILISHPHGWSKHVSFGTSNKLVRSIDSHVPRDQSIEFGYGFIGIIPQKLLSKVPWLDLIEANGKNLETVNGTEVYGDLKISSAKQDSDNTQWDADVCIKIVDDNPKIELQFRKRGNNESNNESELTPDPELLFSFIIPKKITYNIPGIERCEFFQRVTDRFRFPPGTKFHLPNDKKVDFPEQCHFINLFENNPDNPGGFLLYKIQSCAASSGGCVMLITRNGKYSVFPHAGSHRDNNKICYCCGLLREWIYKNILWV